MVAIFVALMFIGLVLVDLVLQRMEARRAAQPAGVGHGVAPLPTESAAEGPLLPWRVPEAVYLAGNHTWLSPEKSGRMTLGADALVAHVLGSVRRVVLSRVGRSVRAGEPLFHLGLNDCELTIVSPVSGKVCAVNRRLEEDPELLSRDPYGAGWVCAVEPVGPTAHPDPGRFGQMAAQWLEDEFVRFREFLSTRVSPNLALGVTSQDGGIPTVGCLALFDRDVWAAFEEEFLRLS